MTTDSEANPLAVLCGDIRSVSEIVSELRTSFRSVDFDRAEAVLVARETALRREVARLEAANQSVMEMRELERVEMAELHAELDQREAGALRADLEAQAATLSTDLEAARERARMAEERLEKLLESVKADHKEEGEMSELRKRCSEAEEEAERWKRSYAEMDERVKLVEANTANLLMTRPSPAARKVTLERSEFTGGNKTSRNAGDVKSASKQPILILDSDDDCAPEGKLSEKESSPKALKRKQSSSLNSSGNKNDEDTGDHVVLDKMGQAQQESVVEPIASPVNNEGLAAEASTAANGAEKPSAACNKTTGAVKCSPADMIKSFWEQLGELDPADNLPSSSSDSDSDSNSGSDRPQLFV